MDIYLYQNDEQVGPFTEEQLRGMVKANTVSEVENAWHEGLAEWQPLNTLITLRVSEPAFRPPLPPTDKSTNTKMENSPIKQNMNEETKRKMIKAYFNKFPTWAVFLIIVGGLCLLVGLNGSGGALAFGLVLVGLGGFAIFSATSGKPTDQQMDEWLEEDLRMLNQKACNKSSLDKDDKEHGPIADAVEITGPRLWDVGGALVLYKKGADNTLRFTPMEVAVINFTPHQIIGYTCVLDRTTGKALNETTDEYFYKDVVSVATKTESQTVKINGMKAPVQMNAAEKFRLTTSGGTSLEVFLRDPSLIEKMGGGEIPNTRAEKATQTVRKMLREKKATP